MTIIQAALIPPGRELELAAKLGDKYIDCPTYVSQHVARGKLIERELPVLRGLALFKNMDLNDPYVWQFVASLIGNVKLLGPVRAVEVDRFKEEVNKKPQNIRTFIPRAGQRVQITNGVFAGRVGICKWANKNYTNILLEDLKFSENALLIPTKDCRPIPKTKS